jgi:hypothetical protein
MKACDRNCRAQLSSVMKRVKLVTTKEERDAFRDHYHGHGPCCEANMNAYSWMKWLENHADEKFSPIGPEPTRWLSTAFDIWAIQGAKTMRYVATGHRNKVCPYSGREEAFTADEAPLKPEPHAKFCCMVQATSPAEARKIFLDRMQAADRTWEAMRELADQVVENYYNDVVIDYGTLLHAGPGSKFVWLLRKMGTHIIFDGYCTRGRAEAYTSMAKDGDISAIYYGEVGNNKLADITADKAGELMHGWSNR